MNEDDFTEDQYYDLVKGFLSEKGYAGPLDRDTVVSDYTSGLSPEESAQEFFEELG